MRSITSLAMLSFALCSVSAFAADNSAPTSSDPVPMTSHAMTFEDYPLEAVRARLQGSVKVRYLIDLDGRVPECMVTESSGKELLDMAACAMVMKRWKFRPALKDGMPIQLWVNGEVTFRLL